MFLVVSNTGNWDHDMWGVVAAVEDMKGFNDYVLDNLPEEDARIRFVDGKLKCYESFEEHEVNFLCEGEPIAYATVEEEACFPSIYYLVELKT